MSERIDFATHMAEKRQREGYSLRGLGRALGLGFSTLARIERREGDPDLHAKRRLEQWLFPERVVGPCRCAKCTDNTGSRFGWECPKCHRVYSPDLRLCPACSDDGRAHNC